MRFVFLIYLFCSSAFADECATNFSGLKKIFNVEVFATHWIETTADDGKPLIMNLEEKENKLFLSFVKTKEGPWASGTADICKKDKIIQAIITKKQINLGNAAPWVMKMSMKSGATFELTMIRPNVLKISTFGWSGEFIPQ